MLSANELHALQSHARARVPRFRHAHADRQARGCRRLGQHGHGCAARDAAPRCGESELHLPPHEGRELARAEEIHHAEEEGIEFHWLTAPVEILDDGKGNVRAMRCIKMELGEPDDSGRRRPVPVPGSEFEFETDVVVFAIGTNANPIIGQRSSRSTSAATSPPRREPRDIHGGVYAGGDIVTGAATVIEAMGAGRKAARSMKAYLGIRDDTPANELTALVFGIAQSERNFARVRAL